jgi:transcriptional antiterminator RfaH
MKKNATSWQVLVVKTGHELKVTRELEASGISVCCPHQTEIRQWSDRKKKVQVPLIPGLVFVRNDFADSTVFLSQSIKYYLFVDGKRAVVRDWELQRLLAFNARVAIHKSKLAVGEKIKLPKLSTEGEVVALHGDYCTVVLAGGAITSRVRLAS